MGQTETRQHRKQISRGTVNRESWLRFLEQITRWEGDSRLINGHKVSGETDSRAIYRWIHEGATPNWIRVDEFLCSYELIFTDFEIWCFCEKAPLWEKDPPDNWT